MSEPQPSRRILRSIGALFAGLVAIVALSLATDAVLHAAGVFPPAGQPVPDALLFLATSYRTVYGGVGSWIAARIAPDRPMGHAVALGALGFFLTAVGMVLTWDRGPEFEAHWYPIALMVLALPAAWLGGRLSGRPPPARSGRP